MFPNKITFVRVGRSRISYTKQIADQAEFFAAITPHLISKDLSYSYDLEKNQGLIFAGFYKVGEFHVAGGDCASKKD